MGKRRTPARGLATNLPNALTSFVGRGNEMAEIKRLLTGVRLLTLTGAGGCGKTRLAVEAARTLLPEYPDGVWLVELAAVADPRVVPNAVASIFGIQERPGRSAAKALLVALRSKPLLLVLDNCEHLSTACAMLAETLLRECPGLQILATSRAPLGLAGETQWRVPSLSLPGPGRALPVRQLADYEAIQLFCERARASLPSFELTARNGPAVAWICTRLDGIPLAIELAAAHVRVLPVEQIASRLTDRFLTGASPTATPRHRTLRAVTDWSFDLLSETERALFRRLAVFAGGWTLSAVEAVCAGTGETAPDVLERLAQLVDKSLVVADPREGEGRYRLLETVREYALEKLAASGDERDVRSRHADWYLALAERARPHLYGRDQEAWLERLEVEHDNLRAALARGRTAEHGADIAMRLAGVLYWFWFLRGHWSEGRRHLEEALGRSAGASRSLLLRVLEGATLFAWRQGDADRARELSEYGLAVCAELGDRTSQPRLLIWLAGAVLKQGDEARAAALVEQSLTSSRELGDKWLVSMALGSLGNLARRQGDHGRAAMLFDEGLTVSREAGDPFRLASALRDVGHMALREGRHAQASAAYKESLQYSRVNWTAAECFLGLALVASAARDDERAARLLGVADALRDTLGHWFAPIEQSAYERCVATTRERLGTLPFASAVAEGRTMTPEDAVALATASVAIEPRDGLTPRELDVAELVAEGLTNRRIAARLGISPRTVGLHVEHILSKLGGNSRSQIAAWAAEHGLRGRESSSRAADHRGA